MTKIKIPIIAASILLAGSCSTGTKTSEENMNGMLEAEELQGDWRLDGYKIDGTPATLGAVYKLAFDASDNTFSLSTDCNTISGEYAISNDTIHFKNILVTEMACDNMTVEQDLLRLFNASGAYATYSDGYTAHTINFHAPSVGDATFSQPGDSPDFTGEYTDPNDGSTLKIGKCTNAGPSVQIGLFRLTDIDDGVGTVSDSVLTFNATDAAGNPIKGKISLDGDTAILVFTESTWGFLPNGSTFRFKRDPEAVVQERNSIVGRTYRGGGNGGGLAIDLTIKFMSDNFCECTSNFYQSFPKAVTVVGNYFVRDGIVEVICRPEGFEDNPIDWYFNIKDGGNELSFNSSDANEEGSIGNDWLTLKL